MRPGSLFWYNKPMIHKKHFEPQNLERYSFLWSEVRLVIAAAALLLGGIPVLRFIFLSLPALSGLINSILTICWLATGAASLYLLYRFYEHKQHVFGGKNRKDVVAFLVSVVSGINLGIVGLTGTNIGMNISSSTPIFTLTAIIYLITAYYLYQRWQENGERVF